MFSMNAPRTSPEHEKEMNEPTPKKKPFDEKEWEGVGEEERGIKKPKEK